MKRKALGRIGGLVQTSIAGYFSYINYTILSNENYGKIIEVLSGDYPSEYKAAGVALLTLDGIMATSAVPLAIVAADGLVDICKGTHHYLGMQICKLITRNPQTRESILKEIESMLVNREEQIKCQNFPIV